MGILFMGSNVLTKRPRILDRTKAGFFQLNSSHIYGETD